MKDLQIFNSPQFGEVRTILDENKNDWSVSRAIKSLKGEIPK